MKEAAYGYTKKLKGVSFDDAVAKVVKALSTEGFGVLTEIDVKDAFKKKLGVEFSRYKILGACNPKLAHRALSSDPMIGLLLPCNVIVFEDGDSVVVSAIVPSEMFKIVDSPEVADLAGEVDAKIRRVMSLVEP